MSAAATQRVFRAYPASASSKGITTLQPTKAGHPTPAAENHPSQHLRGCAQGVGLVVPLGQRGLPACLREKPKGVPLRKIPSTVKELHSITCIEACTQKKTRGMTNQARETTRTADAKTSTCKDRGEVEPSSRRGLWRSTPGCSGRTPRGSDRSFPRSSENLCRFWCKEYVATSVNENKALAVWAMTHTRRQRYFPFISGKPTSQPTDWRQVMIAFRASSSVCLSVLSCCASVFPHKTTPGCFTVLMDAVPTRRATRSEIATSKMRTEQHRRGMKK